MDGSQPHSVEVTIINKRGLHARAAAKFVRAAEAFGCRINVTRDDMTVSGTSILGLMMLAASIGSKLVLEAEGADAGEALQVLGDLVRSGFGEQ